jgi:acyl carrier protein
MLAMTIASRTPEGFPSRCPVCGAETPLEFSDPAGDAPCPNCGHLLWRSTMVLEEIRRQLADTSGLSPEEINADTPITDFHSDSLDVVELVMEWEEVFDISIPDEEAEQIKTVGDLIRFLERRRYGGP